MDIRRVIKDVVRGQEAYPIEDVSYRIKLDANENPYSLSPALRGKMLECMEHVSLNRYPDPGCTELKARFAEYYGVRESMILFGNGSDELILMLLIATRSQPPGGVIIPIPTFAMYRISALNAGHNLVEVPLDSRFDIDLGPFTDAMTKHTPHLIFLSYPNNPPGNLFSRERVVEILAKSEGIVVVDEAYCNFSCDSFLHEIDTWPNLVILRTLSKIGFAALRFGILIAQPELVKELNKVRLPYNINAFSQTMARFFLEHEGDFQKDIQRIIATRDTLFSELEKLEGITPFPTDANFVLFRCASRKNKIYSKLLDRGVLVKQFSAPGALVDCIRVTVGTDDENQEFLRVLKESVRQ